MLFDWMKLVIYTGFLIRQFTRSCQGLWFSTNALNCLFTVTKPDTTEWLILEAARAGATLVNSSICPGYGF